MCVLEALVVSSNGFTLLNKCYYLQEEESSDSNKFYPHLMKPMSNRER